MALASRTLVELFLAAEKRRHGKILEGSKLAWAHLHGRGCSVLPAVEAFPAAEALPGCRGPLLPLGG